MVFVNALVIGFCIAAPVGPIGMLCIQRSLNHGFRTGFATGLGAACADALYGLLGALGVAGVATALPMLTIALKLAGGLFLVGIAVAIARATPAADARETRAPPAARAFATTFALTLSNPMTIVSFVAIFAALGPLPGAREASAWRAIVPLVGGVFAGSAAWWLCLSGASAALRTRASAGLVRGVSLAAAGVIALLGVAQCAAALHGLLLAV